MTYFLVTKGVETDHPTSTLWEAKTETERLHLVLPPGQKAKKVSAQFAHQWVRNGKHHTTPLYLDGNGRIRYARA